MNEGLIARRYAKAILDWATSRNESDELYISSRRLTKALQSVPNLRRTIEDRMVSQGEVMQLVCEAVGGTVPQSFEDAIRVIAEHKREKDLLNIMLMYGTLYRRVHNICVVKMVSAVAVDQQLLEKLRTDIASHTHSQVEFESTIDPSLDGGYVIQIDDHRLDASVRGQLERIRRQFIIRNRTIV